jgi:hypothetical protein
MRQFIDVSIFISSSGNICLFYLKILTGNNEEEKQRRRRQKKKKKKDSEFSGNSSRDEKELFVPHDHIQRRHVPSPIP